MKSLTSEQEALLSQWSNVLNNNSLHSVPLDIIIQDYIQKNENTISLLFRFRAQAIIGAYLHREFFDFTRAFPLLEDAAEFLSNIEENTSLDVSMFLELGFMYSSQSNHSKSEEYLIRGLDIAYKSKNRLSIHLALKALGFQFTHWSQPEQGLIYSIESLKYLDEESFHTAATYCDIGTAYRILQQYETSQEYFAKAVKIYSKYPSMTEKLLYIYIQLITLELSFDKVNEALEHIRNSIDIIRLCDPTPSIIQKHYIILSKKFEIYAQRNDIEQVSQIMNELGTLYTPSNFYIYSNFIKTKSTLAELQGNYKQALLLYKEYVQVVYEKKLKSQQRGAMHIKNEVVNREKQIEQNALRNELLLKNSQLKDIVGVIAKKNEEIAQVLSLVQSIDAQQSTQAGLHKKVAHIGQKLHKALNSQESWNVFDMQFSSLHPDFTKKLLELCPQLSKTELRLCCLLRADLSTKSIASLMHLENETIDQYRHRLRRKLKLPPRTDLNVFMQSL